MKEKSQQGHNRRERARASASLNHALDTLSESQRLARSGDIAAAERAARLAERHAKLAERLIDLKTALRRIANARLETERRLHVTFDAREAALKKREDKLHFAEFDLKRREQHTSPLDPEAERWKELLACIQGEQEG